MAADDGSNGAWHGDTEDHCSTLSLLRFVGLSKQGWEA